MKKTVRKSQYVYNNHSFVLATDFIFPAIFSPCENVFSSTEQIEKKTIQLAGLYV